MIHKSATKAAEITWANGNVLALYLGHNSNTGETIVWQQVAGRRAERITGRNLKVLAAEVAAITPNDGTIAVLNEAAWKVIKEG